MPKLPRRSDLDNKASKAMILTPQQAADIAGYSLRRFQVLLKERRVAGAIQMVNGHWIVPKDFHILPPHKKGNWK
jgi:hypothetical protein